MTAPVDLRVWFATPSGIIARTMGYFRGDWGCTATAYDEPCTRMHMYPPCDEVWDYDTDEAHPVVMVRPAASSDPQVDAYTPHRLALPVMEVSR